MTAPQTSATISSVLEELLGKPSPLSSETFASQWERLDQAKVYSIFSEDSQPVALVYVPHSEKTDFNILETAITSKGYFFTNQNFPLEIHEELLWYSESYPSFQVSSSKFGNCFFFIRNPTTPPPTSSHQGLKIQSPWNFPLGNLLIPHHAVFKNHPVESRFVEILFPENIQLEKRIGFGLSLPLKIDGKKYSNILFVVLKTEEEIKTFGKSTVSLLGEIFPLSKNHWQSYFATTGIGDGLNFEPVLALPKESLPHTDEIVFKLVLQVGATTLNCFFLMPIALVKEICMEIAKEMNLEDPIPHLGNRKDSLFLWAHLLLKRKLNHFPSDRDPIWISDYLNEIEDNDLKILWQNFLLVNYKPEELKKAFYTVDPNVPDSKPMPVFSWMEKKHLPFFAENQRADWQANSVGLSPDEHNSWNEKIFLDLNNAIKADKITLQQKTRDILHMRFLSRIFADKQKELSELTSFEEYSKNINEFPKKNANEMILQLPKREKILSFLTSTGSKDFFLSFQSKNSKEEFESDFQYHRKLYQEKKIDVLDILEARKIVLAPYAILLEAMRDSV